MLMQIVIQNDRFAHQMDVKSTHLNAATDCDFFLVSNLKDLLGQAAEVKKEVYKLKESLYGLK